MKICIIAGRYGLSGVPRAQYRLARALAEYGYEVELIYGAVNPGYKLPVSDKFEIKPE